MEGGGLLVRNGNFNVKNKRVVGTNVIAFEIALDKNTRFLVMGNEVLQPDFGDKKYITSFLFKLKSKPAALYQSLGGFAINGVNLTKLQKHLVRENLDNEVLILPKIFELLDHLCDHLNHIRKSMTQMNFVLDNFEAL